MNLKYIDSLRGLAIFGVILVHTSQFGASIYTHGDIIYPWYLNNLFEHGARGVQLFYVVSAFTLFLSYNSKLIDSSFNTRNFLIRRFFRIAPLYYIGILFFGFIEPFILSNRVNFNFGSVVFNLFFLNSFFPVKTIVPGGWTICVELLFYILLPLLFNAINSTKKALSFTLVALILSIFYNILFFKIFNYNISNKYYMFASFPNQLPLFGFGILAYFLLVKKDYNISKIQLIIIFIFSFLQLALEHFISSHILFGITFILLLFIGHNSKLFDYKPLMFLGRISFSAYFTHFAVLSILNKYKLVDYFDVISIENSFFNFTVRLFVVLFITVLISTLLFYYVEIPFINLGSKAIKKTDIKFKIKKSESISHFIF